MSSQKQSADSGSVAIQSGRDAVVYQGLTPADMKTIMDALAAQLPAFTEIAQQIASARVAEMEQRLLERFANEDTSRREAFKDPDFQYLFTRATYSYARSGDKDVGETLVELIARRSQEKQRTRLSLSLNEAVERAAVLTRNEFAELSVVYWVRNCVNFGIGTLGTLLKALDLVVFPLLDDLSREESSYRYLEAQSCATVGIASVNLIQALHHSYGGVLSKGFERDVAVQHSREETVVLLEAAHLIIPCLNDPAKLQIGAQNRQAFVAAAGAREHLDNLYNMFESTYWSKDELMSVVGDSRLDRLFDVWDNTLMKHLTLTSVGIALAHANLRRVSGFDADLGIWIK